MNDPLHIVCPACAAVNRLTAAKLGDQPVCGKCGQPLFAGAPLDVDAETFQKHLTRNDIPVLVDFWAPWCGPCISMTPALAEATRRLEPAMRVVKLNTEAEQAIASRYSIRSIPTLALFRNGQETGRQAGALDTGRIVAWANGQAKETSA